MRTRISTPCATVSRWSRQICSSVRRFARHSSRRARMRCTTSHRLPTFLPRKVSLGVARIAEGRQEELVVGDLDARRDWGLANDYVRAMWLMLQQEEPGDYVSATGESHSVQELVALAFARVDRDW